MPDAQYDDRRLAPLYDPLDTDRGDLNARRPAMDARPFWRDHEPIGPPDGGSAIHVLNSGSVSSQTD